MVFSLKIFLTTIIDHAMLINTAIYAGNATKHRFPTKPTMNITGWNLNQYTVLENITKKIVPIPTSTAETRNDSAIAVLRHLINDSLVSGAKPTSSEIN